MGFDLTNKNGDYLRFNCAGWGYFLQSVYDLGWKPQGTILPDWMLEEWAESTKRPEPYSYVFFLEDAEGFKEQKHLALEERLASEQIKNIQENIDDYFEIEVNKDFPFGLQTKPYRVTNSEEILPKPKEIKTPEQIAEEWSGTYTSNDFQLITEHDCKSIARVIIKQTMRSNELFPTLTKSEKKQQLMTSGLSESAALEYIDNEPFSESIEKTNQSLIEFFSNGPVQIG